MAFYGLPLVEGDRILTHASEYVSNYLGLIQQARRRGLGIDLVPSDGSGQIDVAALERMIGPRTRLVALTHVPTQGGLVNPAEEVGRVARAHGLIYLLDACQSVGQIALDVGRLGCDVLSGTGRKFLRGPRGHGVPVCVAGSRRADRPAVRRHAGGDLDRAGDATSWRRARGGSRTGRAMSPGRVGLAAAVRYARGIGLGGDRGAGDGARGAAARGAGGGRGRPCTTLASGAAGS